MNESDFPALYEAADTASKKAQKRFFRALAANLICLVVGAAFSVANLPNAWFAVCQSIVLLLSLGLAIYLAHEQPQRIWYETRALAESAKTVTWRYMMRAEPYDGDDDDAKQHFLSGLRRIIADNKQVSARAIEATNPDQVTEKMLANRALNLEQRKRVYEECRVADQHGWYRNKAATNERLSRLWFGGLIAVNGIAVLLAISKIAVPEQNYWPTDIFVTAAGSVMAWIQTKRFQELAASYALAAHEIGLLRQSLPNGGDERSFSKFVGDAENAFSREHTQWQARRDRD